MSEGLEHEGRVQSGVQAWEYRSQVSPRRRVEGPRAEEVMGVQASWAV